MNDIPYLDILHEIIQEYAPDLMLFYYRCSLEDSTIHTRLKIRSLYRKAAWYGSIKRLAYKGLMDHPPNGRHAKNFHNDIILFSITNLGKKVYEAWKQFGLFKFLEQISYENLNPPDNFIRYINNTVVYNLKNIKSNQNLGSYEDYQANPSKIKPKNSRTQKLFRSSFHRNQARKILSKLYEDNINELIENIESSLSNNEKTHKIALINKHIFRRICYSYFNEYKEEKHLDKFSFNRELSYIVRTKLSKIFKNIIKKVQEWKKLECLEIQQAESFLHNQVWPILNSNFYNISQKHINYYTKFVRDLTNSISICNIVNSNINDTCFKLLINSNLLYNKEILYMLGGFHKILKEKISRFANERADSVSRRVVLSIERNIEQFKKDQSNREFRYKREMIENIKLNFNQYIRVNFRGSEKIEKLQSIGKQEYNRLINKQELLEEPINIVEAKLDHTFSIMKKALEK